SRFIHDGPNLEHMDLEATDVSTQLHPKQMDEGFTATAYPNVQENLKLTVEEQVILEEPTSSTWTLSSLQHLAKDFSFGDLFFNDKHSEAENEKTTAETKAESMVSLKIQQDTSAIPPMTTPVIDLTSRPDSPNVHRPLQATAIETIMTTTTTTHPPPPKQQQSTTDSMLIKRIDELEKIMANLIQDNKHLEGRLDSHGARLYTLENLDIPQDLPEADLKEILHQRMWETNSYKAHEDHMMLYEALEKSMNRQSHGSTAPSSLKIAASAEYTSWITTDTRLKPSVSSILEFLYMDDDMAPDEHVHSSDDEDIRNAYIPKVNLQQDWWKPLEEDRSATPKPAWSIPSSDLPVLTNNWASALASTYTPPPENTLLAQTGDMAMFMDWFFKRQGITELKPQDLEGPAFELVKVFHPNVIHLQYQMEKCHKLLTDSVDESIIRHNVSKPLPLVFLIGGSKDNDSTLTYTHLRVIAELFQAVRVFGRFPFTFPPHLLMYGYDYIKKIILRRANLNEHIIAERDFKYLYPSTFEDLYLLNLQGHLNHLPPKDKKILTIAINLWTRHLVIRQRVEDFQLRIESY
nr:hypothetical protein [Tanacetum cinerariifolium]